MKTAPATISRHPAAGFTLTALLVAMAISAVVLSQLVVATCSLQRSFEAANYWMSAQEDQLRVIDYVTRDLHTASAVAVLNGRGPRFRLSPPAMSGVLNLNLGPLLTPAIASLGLAAGSPTTVTYSAEGGQFVRQVAARRRRRIRPSLLGVDGCRSRDPGQTRFSVVGCRSFLPCCERATTIIRCPNASSRGIRRPSVPPRA